MYENSNKILSSLFNSQNRFIQKSNTTDQDDSFQDKYIIKKYQVCFKEEKSQKKLTLNFQTIDNNVCQNESLLIIASSFTKNIDNSQKIIQEMCKRFKIIQFDYLDFQQYQKDYSIDQWIAFQIKQILVAAFHQFLDCKKIYLLGEVSGACGIIDMLIDMNKQTKNQQKRYSSLRFSVFENLSLTNSQIPQFCNSVINSNSSCHEVEKIKLEQVNIDEQALYKLISGVILIQPYNNCKQHYTNELKNLSGLKILNSLIFKITVTLNYPKIFSKQEFQNLQQIDKPVAFLFSQNQDLNNNISIFNIWGSNIKKLRITKEKQIEEQDIIYLKNFLVRLEQNFFQKKVAKYSVKMYMSELWKNNEQLRQSDLMSCETKTLNESHLNQNQEDEKRDTIFSNTESMISQVIFKNRNKNEMIKRVQLNNMPKKKKSHFGYVKNKNKTKENVFNQFRYNLTVVDQQMNLNLEELEKLYKESDNLLSKISNIQELCEPAQQFLQQVSVQKVKDKEFIYKLWANQLINKLYHFDTNVLPQVIVDLIIKCIEYNLLNCNYFQMLNRYENLPDCQSIIDANKNSSEIEDKFINSTLYTKLRKILQIDDSQYFVDGMVGNALLDLNGNFVWMDQQAQDIFEVPSLKDGGVNFFDLLVDESKRKIQQKLGSQDNDQIQLLDPETMENTITYIIFSQTKQKKVQNFMRKKSIKKLTKLEDKYFFNLYLKCLVSHLQLTQVVFNIKNLTKEFEEIQAEDPSHFEDKKINKIEDQFQNELNLPFFKNTKKKGNYLIKMSTRIAKNVDYVPSGPTCNTKLIKSLGFQGFKEPTQIKLQMCPFIENSCCTTFDQEEIYTIWVINKQREELKERFQFYGDVYNRVLKKGEKFHIFLLQIIKQMQSKSFSNCKIIASRLAQFQFKTISEQLQEAIKTMYQYFEDLYSGFYCTMCDADSQPYFRPDKEAIQYQKKFCRDIISQSVNVLLYLHINLKKYLNLATRFMSNCDFEGNYTKSDAEDSFIFTINKDDYHLLNDCKAYINEVFWMDYCEPICQKFNLFDLDEFFTPDLKQFAYYNKFFAETLEKLEKDQEKAKKKQQKLNQKEVRGLMDFRILEEKKNTNAKEHSDSDEQEKHHKNDDYYMELVDSYLDQPIYYEPAKSPYSISEFRSMFADSDIGIDLTVIGKKTEISEKIKNSIEAEKKVLAHQELLDQNKKQLEEISKQVDSEEKPKKKIENGVSSNITILKVMFIVLAFAQVFQLILIQVNQISKHYHSQK